MFQAFGVHGPELTPFGSMLLDIALVSAAFAFLLSAPRANRMTAAMLMTMVLAITALRVVMQPLPNVQPVTVAALLVGHILERSEVLLLPSSSPSFPTSSSAMVGGRCSKPLDGQWLP